MLHPFAQDISQIPLPAKFTYPFNYTPHPLCVIAAKQLQTYIQTKTEWAEELSLGKMFGVLVVENNRGELYFLAAFSGNLAGQNIHPHFVPPVFDMLQKDDFFLTGVKKISAINERLDILQQDASYLASTEKLNTAKAQSAEEIEAQKQANKLNKQARDTARKTEGADLEALAKASVYDKAYLRHIQNNWQEKISELEKELSIFTTEIDGLKLERKTRSAALQQEIFNRFQFLNNEGETQGLCSIFEKTPQKTPPAGAGECAGPKLLQYAYLHNLKPVAMAEFWWGASPKNEIRQHGQFYPACKGKCEPILGHMLVGLDTDPDPLHQEATHKHEIEILYEDEFLLVINKPAGMLSVPGKSNTPSVYSYVQSNYPEATGPLIVHRLDMATSGLLLIAKTKEIHKELQAQFHLRSIKKRYVAILDGIIEGNEGEINLPLATDYNHRPMQMVDFEHGKPALTLWKVLSRTETQTRIAFFPITGRTHQLRVHAAHPQALNCPILGDELYGRKANRLHLHAEYLEFEHPVLKRVVCVEREAEF